MFLLDSSNKISTTKMELVLEKISRPAHQPVIAGPRLLRTLDESLSSCASTIISGRAGTGKTSLALDFSFHCGRPTAWYKVDAPESELKIFFQYLIASVQKQRPGFGTEILAPLVSVAELAHIPLLAEAFVYELAEGDNSPLLICHCGRTNGARTGCGTQRGDKKALSGIG